MRASLMVWLLFGPGVAACVPHVAVDGAPCPCPEGFDCCATLSQCIPAGGQCPATYPPSSMRTCRWDSDCTPNEMCQSWISGGTPAGPGVCRRCCPDRYTCADGEVCELAPHDNRPLEDMSLGRICVPAAPPAGCESQGCRDCDLSQLGNTFCDGNRVRGWFLALHPRCGLTCRSILVTDCTPDTCEIFDGTARCAGVANHASPCAALSCSQCGAAPGSFFCDGTKLAVCASLPIDDVTCGGACGCRQVCSREVVRSCTSCVVESSGPSCSP
jgi:hypothetical protein